MKGALLTIGIVLAVVFAAVYFSDDHQAFIAYDEQRQAWHRRCDLYIDKPVVSPAAMACEEEMKQMIAYAERRGWK